MFKPISPQVDFPKLERDLLKKWDEDKLLEKYLHRNDSSEKRFSFLDGPITANNPMGVHHAWGRTYKDIWQRFFNMQGYKQRFQNGFDCQGLWVEVEVEKELGIKTKKDIENLVSGDKKASIAKFVELCRERVKKYSAIQTDQSKRLGYFMDWNHSYFTMSEENNYMIWHFLKKCFDLGLIYKGHDVVPWCPRCETAISQHEMLTEDYKEITHDSIFIRYPVEGKESTYLLAWTTTPWTLPGNVAVAVDAKKDYVQVQEENKQESYFLVKEAAERLKLKIIKTFKGQELVGLTYSSPFDNLPLVSKTLGSYKHRVIATDTLILPVTTEEGTGMVHIATGQGAEDFHLGKKEKLPVIELIDDEAFYLDGLDEFSKQSAKKHPEIIIEYLQKAGNLFKTEKYTHRYPACWRCKTELVWKVADEWYIAMDKPLSSKLTLREELMKVAKKINWIPDFGLERELDWLKNMHDWLISKKNRYWGLALPIWECQDCGHFEIIGSKKELEEKAVAGWDEFKDHTPHKPWIDEVKIKCAKCGKTAQRVLDVGNPWLDAGIVPFSTITENNQGEPLYNTDKAEFAKWFPVDFITESFPGQFKNWFYSLLAMSTVLEEKEPFKTVLGFATLFGEDGRPMHKSWGNSVEFNEGADKIGVDVMRWMYVRQNPTDNLLFGYRVADETRRKFHLMLWNIYNFFVTYAQADNWQLKSGLKQPDTGNILDKWIISRLNNTIEASTKSLENFNAQLASESLENFVNDLSLWYVRRSRDRIGPTAENGEDKNDCYNTLYFVLVTLVKLLAPFIPFIAEEIYTNLTDDKSVHLSDWPMSNSKSIDHKLESDMNLVREIVEAGHSIRKKNNLKVRQPLSKLWFAGFVSAEKKRWQEFEKLLRDELNVKEIDYSLAEEIMKDEANIEIYSAKNPYFSGVFINIELNDELLNEGLARDIIRKIQEERKNMQTDPSATVKVTVPYWPEQFENYIKKKALVSSIAKGDFKVEK